MIFVLKTISYIFYFFTEISDKFLQFIYDIYLPESHANSTVEVWATVHGKKPVRSWPEDDFSVRGAGRAMPIPL